MAKKKTIEEIKIFVEKDGSILLDAEYTNSITPLHMICVCGESFEKSYKIMKNSGLCMCNDCIIKLQHQKQMLSQEELEKRLNEIDMMIVLAKNEEYKGVNHKYHFICKSKNHKTHSYLNDVLNKNKGCKECHRIEMAKNMMTDFKELKGEYEKEGYKIITTEEEYYENRMNYLIVVCKKGHTFPSNISNFRMKKTGCPYCYNEIRSQWAIIPYNIRKEEVEKEGYKIKTKEKDYIDGSHEVKFICDCGHEYISTIHDFKNGHRCPYCNISKGERKILLFLKQYNLGGYDNFQYRFNDCKCQRILPFDFYLPQYNCCIEYDGKQHYLYGGFGNDLLKLMNIKYRDNIKTNYCQQNNIKLIRIPYWDFDNIEEILKQQLNL